jgi:hypothetical protein
MRLRASVLKALERKLLRPEACYVGMNFLKACSLECGRITEDAMETTVNKVVLHEDNPWRYTSSFARS